MVAEDPVEFAKEDELVRWCGEHNEKTTGIRV